MDSDGDLLRLRFVGFRDVNLENAVTVVGFDFIALDHFGSSNFLSPLSVKVPSLTSRLKSSFFMPGTPPESGKNLCFPKHPQAETKPRWLPAKRISDDRTFHRIGH
jgi:hypothetical protein